MLTRPTEKLELWSWAERVSKKYDFSNIIGRINDPNPDYTFVLNKHHHQASIAHSTVLLVQSIVRRVLPFAIASTVSLLSSTHDYLIGRSCVVCSWESSNDRRVNRCRSVCRQSTTKSMPINSSDTLHHFIVRKWGWSKRCNQIAHDSSGLIACHILRIAA